VSFGTYVEGRRIALVGPAKPYKDQSAEIEAHDLVYRIGFIKNIPPEYGTRTDIAFLNGAASRTLHDDDMRDWFDVYDDVPWLIMKNRRGYRRQGNYRHVDKPRKVRNGNQATLALHDLLQYAVASVTVFGVDLYSSGPSGFYHDDYLNWVDVLTHPDRDKLEDHASAFLGHHPFDQIRSHRRSVASGKVLGDDRYLAAVNQSDEEYQAIIDKWQAVLKEARS
jgi:hypothetical protein